MEPISCKQEIGDTEKLLCPGAPQGPAGFHKYPRDVDMMSFNEFRDPRRECHS